MDGIIYTEPDIDFLNYLKKDCGSAISTCMQCGSCTAVCDLSTGPNPWPRKEMIWAAWGLKDKLLGDPDIWLCHNCGDCTSTCPRDVRPGDVIASIRDYNYIHYARPRFLAKWLRSPKCLPLIILIPVIIICGIIVLAGTFRIPDGPVNYSEFFPHVWLNGSFSVIVLAMLIGMYSSFRSFKKDMRKNMKNLRSESKQGFLQTMFVILKHRDFKSCTNNRYRYLAHMLVFWGFILLLLVTVFAILALIFFEYPFDIFHPVKIAGNIAGIALIAGCILMIFQKLKNSESKGASHYTDWWFLISLLLLSLSGMLVEGARFHGWSFAYYLYFIHLLLVWMVVIYLPYTRFVHIIYRTVVLVYSGRWSKER